MFSMQKSVETEKINGEREEFYIGVKEVLNQELRWNQSRVDSGNLDFLKNIMISLELS